MDRKQILEQANHAEAQRFERFVEIDDPKPPAKLTRKDYVHIRSLTNAWVCTHCAGLFISLKTVRNHSERCHPLPPCQNCEEQ